MKDRLGMQPCLALALWSHWHVPQVLITESTPRGSCGRTNMEDAWHLDTWCKIHWDNWDTTEREVQQVLFELIKMASGSSERKAHHQKHDLGRAPSGGQCRRGKVSKN